MTMTVMIVDGQRAARLRLAPMIGKTDGLRAIAQAGSGQDVLDQLAEIKRRRTPRSDMVLMDARMSVLSGIDTTAATTRKHPGVKVLMLATYGQGDYTFGMFRAGTSGFLLRDARTTDLHQTLRAVTAGNAILTPCITRQPLERHIPRTTTPRQRTAQECLGLLAPRGREVAGLVAQGITSTEIDRRLFIQPESAKKAVTQILAKLQPRDRVQLVIILRDVQPSH